MIILHNYIFVGIKFGDEILKICKKSVLIFALLFFILIGGVCAVDDSSIDDAVSSADDSPDDVISLGSDDGSAGDDVKENVVEQTAGNVSDSSSKDSDVLGATAEKDVLGVDVTTYTNLNNAISNGGQINIKNDITMTDTLSITKTTTIYGENHALDGNSHRIFTVNSGVTVTFNDVVFKNGYDSSRAGAVYLSAGSSATFINCSFINNKASSGGAVASMDADATFKKCTFDGNTANVAGGGIYILKSLTTEATFNFEECNIKNNKAQGIGTSEGGGFIFIAKPSSGTVTQFDNLFFKSSNFTNNTAAIGGAVNLYMTNKVSFDNCNFNRNNASGGNTPDGGAIYVYYNYGSVLINNSKFTDNYAQRYGGAYRTANIYSTYQFINNCTFENCHADSNGGAVSANSPVTVGGPFNISNSKFIGNYAPTRGAISMGAYEVGYYNLYFINNKATAGDASVAYFGFGLKDPKFINVTVINNTAAGSGSFYFVNSTTGNFNNKISNVIYENCKFINNSASSYGSIYMPGGATNWTFDECSFINNSVNGASAYGGALYISENGKDILFNNSEFISNKVKNNGRGGAIFYNGASTNIGIIDCNFDSNSAQTGGAIYFSASSGTFNNIDITNSNFTNNKATSDDSSDGVQ